MQVHNKTQTEGFLIVHLCTLYKKLVEINARLDRRSIFRQCLKLDIKLPFLTEVEC